MQIEFQRHDPPDCTRTCQLCPLQNFSKSARFRIWTCRSCSRQHRRPSFVMMFFLAYQSLLSVLEWPCFFFFVLWKHNLLVTLELTFCLWYVRLAPTTLWIGLQPCGGLSTFEPQKACSSRTFSCSASRAIGVATWWRFCRISIALSPRRWQRLQALRAGARRSEWSKRMCAKRSILTIWV